ncbi:MAG: hypothetical protein IJ654_05285 [Bacteroidales bacterium]|nr:hypothetical protein [Bacteroidales bacterium]
MYTKEINCRTVFSDCKAIQLPSGQWVSNPSAEQIASAGWTELPPDPEPYTPEPQTEPDYDQILAAVKKMLASSTEDLSDEDALDVAALFPTWSSKQGKPVEAGERLWYDGKLYKVIQAHTVQDDWAPDTAASLYTEVSIAEVPDWVQPLGAETAYMTGDKVKYDGGIWESDVDGNVWEPGVYGWRLAD